MLVGNSNSQGNFGQWGDKYYSLIQFDLSQMPNEADSAVISLYCYSSDGTPTNIALFRNMSSWDWKNSGTGPDHERLWWSDLPKNELISNNLLMPNRNAWYDIDITSLYNSWQARH